jgi:hypothetical protein
MLNKLKSWWTKWGQLWGFGTIVTYLFGFLIYFDEQLKDPGNEWIALIWIVQFLALSYLWSYIMKKMGWRMSKDVRRTHSW